MSSPSYVTDEESDREVYLKPGNIEIEHIRRYREAITQRSSDHEVDTQGAFGVFTRANDAFSHSQDNDPRDRGDQIRDDYFLPGRHFPSDDEVTRVRRDLFQTTRDPGRVSMSPRDIRSFSLMNTPKEPTDLISFLRSSPLSMVRTRSQTITVSSGGRPIVAVCEHGSSRSGMLSGEFSAVGRENREYVDSRKTTLAEILSPTTYCLPKSNVSSAIPMFEPTVTRDHYKEVQGRRFYPPLDFVRSLPHTVTHRGVDRSNVPLINESYPDQGGASPSSGAGINERSTIPGPLKCFRSPYYPNNRGKDKQYGSRENA